MKLLAAGLVLGLALFAGHSDSALAASGVQVTRDGSRTLVSKDVGNERWAITFNLDDQTATGNIFRSDGGEAAFVWCSVGANDGTTLSLSCFGADRCPNAPCDQSQWGFIGSVDLPAQFFLPPGESPLTTCPLRRGANGANASSADSHWDCHVVGAFPPSVFQLQIFENGTGNTSAVGPFQFGVTACGTGTVDLGNGQALSITDMTGSRETGVLTYRENGPGFDDRVVCALVRF